jgi:HEAT repeat protein
MYHAGQYLGERGKACPQVRRALLHVLHESAIPGGVLLRDAVVKSLEQLRDTSPDVISALIALLPHDILLPFHESILQRLLHLSQLSSDVVPMLVQALQDAAPYVRVAVAPILEMSGSLSSDVLEQFQNVQPQHAPVRALHVPYSIKQWYWLPDSVEAFLLYRMHNRDERRDAVKSLGQLDELSERAENALLVALHDESAHVRAQVIQTLFAYDLSAGVLDIFIHMLSSDTDCYVRACIVKCLGEIDQPCDHVVQALFQAIQDTDEYVRVCAIESLGRLAPTTPDVVSTLLRVLRHDPGFGVRWQVVKYPGALQELPLGAIPVLVQALTDEHWYIREDCAHLLGHSRSLHKSTIPALVHGLSDTNMAVRKACSQALVQLGQRFPRSKKTITKQVAQMIRAWWHDAMGYDTPCEVAYESLWLLVNDSSGMQGE